MEPQPSFEPETLAERRASRRVRVTCDAALLTMTTQTSGSLVDISEAGARFEAAEPPGSGATALLRWNNREAVCTIVWSEGEACGLSFANPLPAEVVAETAALDRVLELPIASVGNITQGRKRSLSFLKTAPAEPVLSGDSVEAPAPGIGGASLAEVLAHYRRTGSWER